MEVLSEMPEESKNINLPLIFYLVLLLFLFSLAVFLIGFFRNKSVKTEDLSVGQDNLEKNGDFFLGNYFDEKFKEDSGKDLKKKSSTLEGNCQLFNQEVMEGTVIFDSTCAVEER